MASSSTDGSMTPPTPQESDLKLKPENELETEDLADNPRDAPQSNIEHEYSIPNTVKLAWLSTYFFFSLLLTLYNKLVLGIFSFPWLLTCIHASFASVGTLALMQLGYFKLSRLGRRENLALVAFSALFTANIALSNLSLAMVSVPFYQTMRMLCPFFTLIIYRVWYGRTYSTLTYMSLVPLIIGAAMTTAGEMTFSDAGFLLTILGVILAAVKACHFMTPLAPSPPWKLPFHLGPFALPLLTGWQTVVTNRFMTGSLALPPLEFVLRMSPLAALQALVCAVATGEVNAFRDLIARGDISLPPVFASLAGNGFLAFLLNVSSFSTNKLAGALTMTVCGNLKQCLTVLIGIFLFNVTIDLLNGTGMAVTMLGAAIYSKAELDNKKKHHINYRPLDQEARDSK